MGFYDPTKQLGLHVRCEKGTADIWTRIRQWEVRKWILPKKRKRGNQRHSGGLEVKKTMFIPYTPRCWLVSYLSWLSARPKKQQRQCDRRCLQSLLQDQRSDYYSFFLADELLVSMDPEYSVARQVLLLLLVVLFFPYLQSLVADFNSKLLAIV